jgi:hypothetical protein
LIRIKVARVRAFAAFAMSLAWADFYTQNFRGRGSAS